LPASLACAALLAAPGCAHRGGPPPEDATRDPEFQAALREARREFPTQREALEAGLYETFLPPESLPPPVADPGAVARAEPAGPSPADATVGGDRRPPVPDADPTTEEILATLPPAAEPPARPTPSPARPAPAGPAGLPPGVVSPPARGDYTLQLGAFGSASAAWARADEARAVAPGWPVAVIETAGLHRVFLGAFPSRAEAEAGARRLTPLGLGDAWVTIRPPR
jgi:cell division septation protein DedD